MLEQLHGANIIYEVDVCIGYHLIFKLHRNHNAL